MAAASSAPQPEPVWYVQAGERVWGPYPSARLQVFLAEGRLSAQSLVASQASGPFGPAGRRRELQALFPAEPAPHAHGPAPAAPRPETAPTAARALMRPLVVWAGLASLTPARFEAVLAAYGAYVAIRPGLWLVRAGMGAAALRNALSRRLRSEDALLVVEAPLEQAAWFNLDGSLERHLRQLWGSEPG